MFMAFFMENNKQNLADVELRQLKFTCLDKAVECYKYNQSIPVVELANKIEGYLLSVNVGNPN